MTERQLLLIQGQQLLAKWCNLNCVKPPEIKIWYSDPPFDTCAYYRDDLISIWPHECARIGVSARQWSYPGYVVDRTPYGVLQHELGHHVDEAKTYRRGILSSKWREATGELKLTSYCDNDMEWFAELFRLFVSNPDLLQILRPKIYRLMIERWPKRAEERNWAQVLVSAQERWRIATQNHIVKAARAKQGELLYG
jgi:hypothetical protein